MWSGGNVKWGLDCDVKGHCTVTPVVTWLSGTECSKLASSNIILVCVSRATLIRGENWKLDGPDLLPDIYRFTDNVYCLLFTTCLICLSSRHCSHTHTQNSPLNNSVVIFPQIFIFEFSLLSVCSPVVLWLLLSCLCWCWWQTVGSEGRIHSESRDPPSATCRRPLTMELMFISCLSPGDYILTEPYNTALMRAGQALSLVTSLFPSVFVLARVRGGGAGRRRVWWTALATCIIRSNINIRQNLLVCSVRCFLQHSSGVTSRFIIVSVYMDLWSQRSQSWLSEMLIRLTYWPHCFNCGHPDSKWCRTAWVGYLTQVCRLEFRCLVSLVYRLTLK